MLKTEPLKIRQEEITYLQGLLLESVRRENKLKSDLEQANQRLQDMKEELQDMKEELQNAYERIDDLELELSETCADLERACIF